MSTFFWRQDQGCTLVCLAGLLLSSTLGWNQFWKTFFIFIPTIFKRNFFKICTLGWNQFWKTFLIFIPMLPREISLKFVTLSIESLSNWTFAMTKTQVEFYIHHFSSHFFVIQYGFAQFSIENIWVWMSHFEISWKDIVGK